MDLGNVFKYDIDTLKSLHNELNKANVESGGWIGCTTDEKIYTIFKGGRVVVTSRLLNIFNYHPTDTPTYCTSPYRPNLIEWENGNNQDEIEEVKSVTIPKSSNEQPSVEQAVFECFEDNTNTSSDNLPVFPIDKAYCNFDPSNIVHGRLRGGR